jgi:hypothetical protein
VVKQRLFDTLRLQSEEVAEFNYRPTACAEEYRMVVVRKNIPKEQGELRLVTWNMESYTPTAILLRHTAHEPRAPRAWCRRSKVCPKPHDAPLPGSIEVTHRIAHRRLVRFHHVRIGRAGSR